MTESVRSIRIPQQRRSIEKRAKLVAAARTVFGQKGFHAASTADIVKESGLSTGTLYSYFVDKRQLFLEAVQANYDTVDAALAETLAQTAITDTEVLRKVLPATIYANVDSIPFHKEIMAMVFTDPEVRQLYFTHQESVIDLIHANMRRLHLAVTRETVFLIVTVVENIGREFTYHPKTTLDRDTLHALVEEYLMRLVQRLVPEPPVSA